VSLYDCEGGCQPRWTPRRLIRQGLSKVLDEYENIGKEVRDG
jgi:hypothetical protein